jgi:hypothetical protein
MDLVNNCVIQPLNLRKFRWLALVKNVLAIGVANTCKAAITTGTNDRNKYLQ